MLCSRLQARLVLSHHRNWAPPPLDRRRAARLPPHSRRPGRGRPAWLSAPSTATTPTREGLPEWCLLTLTASRPRWTSTSTCPTGLMWMDGGKRAGWDESLLMPPRPGPSQTFWSQCAGRVSVDAALIVSLRYEPDAQARESPKAAAHPSLARRASVSSLLAFRKVTIKAVDALPTALYFRFPAKVARSSSSVVSWRRTSYAGRFPTSASALRIAIAVAATAISSSISLRTRLNGSARIGPS